MWGEDGLIGTEASFGCAQGRLRHGGTKVWGRGGVRGVSPRPGSERGNRRRDDGDQAGGEFGEVV